jgi:hypothetical protein
MDPMAFKLGLFGGGGSGGGGGGSSNPNSTSTAQVKRAAQRRQAIPSVSAMGSQPTQNQAVGTADSADVTYENTYTDLAGRERSYKTLNGQVIEGYKPTEFTDFQNYDSVVSSDEAEKYFSMAPPAGDLIYSPDQQPQSARPPEPFVGNVDRGAVPGTVAAPRRAVVSGNGSSGASAAAMTELGLPSRDFYVEKQQFSGPAGGAPGVGEQGFGRRALLGAEGEIVAGTVDDGAVQTETPSVENQGDLAADPNAVPLTTDQSVVQDVNYVMPTVDEEGNVVGFDPNDPRAQAMATGPMSSNLMNRRRGFGAGVYTR